MSSPRWKTSEKVNEKEFHRKNGKIFSLKALPAEPWQCSAAMKPFRASLRQIQKHSADFDEIVVILRHFSSLLAKQTPVNSLLAFRNLTDLTGLKKSSIFSILG